MPDHRSSGRPSGAYGLESSGAVLSCVPSFSNRISHCRGENSMAAPAPSPRSYANLTPGDPAPWFRQRSTSNPNYAFDSAAGRYIVLCFFGSAGDAAGRTAMERVLANRRQFDDVRLSLFGVSLDPRD